MKKYLKNTQVMEPFERYLALTYYKIVSLIPKALYDWEMRQTRGVRSLRLVLLTAAYTKDQIIEALNQAEDYLKMLAGPDGLITRQDSEFGEMIVSVFTGELQDRPDLADDWPTDKRGSRWAKLRFDLTLYDKPVNEILDRTGVVAVVRMAYMDYGRELLRIRQTYSRGEWATKMQEVRARDPYKDLDVSILSQLDLVFLPEL